MPRTDTPSADERIDALCTILIEARLEARRLLAAAGASPPIAPERHRVLTARDLTASLARTLSELEERSPDDGAPSGRPPTR